MGREWDGQATPQASYRFHRAWAVEALRVAKPGAHLLAFGGTRVYHRLACALEDAGWTIRDDILHLLGLDTKFAALWNTLDDNQRQALAEVLNDYGLSSLLAWCYSQGFPKSLDIAKAIDKEAGAPH